MKGKLDKAGNLHIWRGKAWKLQDCPYGTLCGDHCARFTEPHLYHEGGVNLRICGDDFFIEHFTDDRG
jgi:hypothetical protein